jgi:hypothetical protein
MRAAAVLAGLVVMAAAGAAHADTPRAGFRMRGGQQAYVDVPFFLDLIVEGFDEAPAPAQPLLDIKGAQVAPIGATPNVSHGLQIINGRQQQWSRVSWVLRYRVIASKDGTLRVPETKVVQGGKSALADSGEIPVASLPTSDDMKLALELPARPVFVGETVPVKLVWLFKRQPADQSFAVPMMSLDAFTISGPPVTDKRKALEFPAGSKDITLPYEIDTVTVGGVEFNRLAVTFFAAPRKTGKVDIPPSSVIAALEVGRRDFFGQAPTKMFRAADVARALEVKPLPESGRPPTFAGAVGEQFSIEVRTSRSVVQLGEPVELDVTIKSNQRLDTLALGRLALPTDKFTVPADQPTGVLSDDGKQKAFKVTAQVTGPATEVPAIPFAYFDPAKGTYVTIHSEPIALSVKGGSIVGAGDVVAATPSKRSAAAPTDDTAIGNADLALSSPSQLAERPFGGTLLWLLVGLLYAVPLAVLAWFSWAARTRDRREEAAEVRAARKKVEELLDRAGTSPAREIAGPLAAALRELARLTGHSIDDHGLLAKLETESFAPAAAQQPLSPDLRSDAAGLLRRWLAEARTHRASKAAVVAAVLIATCAHAPDARADALADGRAAYQDAMALTTNPTARKAAFARAATALAEAVRTHPDQPELLVDWGNAALGGGDVATATLAYRRALTLDRGNTRARTNLAWLRTRQPDAFRPITTSSATETLLFFHHWSLGWRLVVGAVAFALGTLLLVPWRGRRSRTLAGVALIPFAIWLALLASILLEDRHADDAVVMDGVVLRAADSAGAPAALTQPLPRGAEVTILERRAPWTRVQIASGAIGWVPDGAVERVAP